MNNTPCQHGATAPSNLFQQLHHNQGGSGRHHCTVCAYEEGFIIGSTKVWKTYDEYIKSNGVNDEVCPNGTHAPTSILTNLEDGQAGEGRHMCCNCAFKLGFEEGISTINISNSSLKKVAAPLKVPLPKSTKFKAHKGTNYVIKEIENSKLGLQGELFVLELEKKNLINSGRKDLADKVEHSSVVQGDGLGYDVLSYDANGNVKYIEVKTTRGDINRAFFISDNELEYSKTYPNNYFLYRVFDFNSNKNKAEYYELTGDISIKLNLKTSVYLATPN
tara:strand:- start:3701 stop:4528 length:828 start_codon:yes stop_codon:yes gene_type:complete